MQVFGSLGSESFGASRSVPLMISPTFDCTVGKLNTVHGMKPEFVLSSPLPKAHIASWNTLKLVARDCTKQWPLRVLALKQSSNNL
jgi:hypothetical protein